MPMPEATVDQYHRFPPAQHNVGFSRKASVVQTKTKAQAVKNGTDGHFRLRVRSLHEAHDGRAFQFAYVVHGLKKNCDSKACRAALVGQSPPAYFFFASDTWDGFGRTRIGCDFHAGPRR